jgi:exodeoxyribonuclease V alpha subunit
VRNSIPPISDRNPEKLKSGSSFGESHGGHTENDEFFSGTIEKISYRNPENGFSVLRASSDTSNDLSQHTVVGLCSHHLSEGSSFIARGSWQSHSKFGKQFKAASITERMPTSRESIIKYLASGLVKGIGEKLAERIVNHFGEDTLQIIESTPERISEVSGIGESKVEELKRIWAERKEERETLLYFQNYGISPALSRRIYNAFGATSIETVKNNPYILCHEVWGIGFHTADKIASALGIEAEDTERLMAGFRYLLEESQSEGHTYIPYTLLLRKAMTLLSISEETLLAKALNQACLHGHIHNDSERYYVPSLFSLERNAAEKISERIHSADRSHKPIPAHLVEETLLTRKTGEAYTDVITLSDEQKHAVELAAKEPLLVITGGPGCGKTTVVKSLVSLYRKAGLQIRLCAPTGRAAQRLQEVCAVEASTIHRLLKFDPIKRAFMHDESNPLPFDVLIIDESSMIDIPLASSLLRAIKNSSRLIFVGDADQLPSVGPGLFFADLLEIDSVPKVKLTRLFRRSEESSINEIAHQINRGSTPSIPQPDGTGIRDAYFIPIKNSAAGIPLIERLVSEQIPKKFNIPSRDITVLSPMNQGDLGIISLNKRLQQKLLAPSPNAPRVIAGSNSFFVGDRVCQRVNNYSIHDNGVFNGEQGIIYGIDTEAKSVYVKLWDGRDITYTKDDISQLDLAYALTIHRSQGSEVPVIVLILHDSHRIMLERQLFYTAVTRAKKLLVLVGTQKAISVASRQIRSSRRYTGFRELVTRYSQQSDTEYENDFSILSTE